MRVEEQAGDLAAVSDVYRQLKTINKVLKTSTEKKSESVYASIMKRSA
ncbi:hypothetical protein G6045_05770 [Streptomyces sp. YC504]|uniref:Uncharacterized protein n=1 Tax=Streptomyces mesophilus TaxID=1775132 RepID=A0A6G4XD82_9ACTN|nr:hypothetical protein [Streptomyces mesophilus]NGO75193.1 hypothetical protein [Streptomyces mesophilus]